MAAAVNRSRKALMGIREMIVAGEFPSGARVSEVMIAEKLGLSRTPVRAALARLEQEGLLEALPSGGYSARSFTVDDVTDAIELRGVLEGTAARLAAERGVTAEVLEEMRETIAILDRAMGKGPDSLDVERYVDLNARFHEQLASAPGSRTIKRELERITSQPFASPSAFLQNQTDVPAFRLSLISGQAHHRDIVDAIARREGARAESLAREHARLARRNLDYVLNEDRRLMDRVPALVMVNA